MEESKAFHESRDIENSSKKLESMKERVKRIELENSALRERIARLSEMSEYRRAELQARKSELETMMKFNQETSSDPNRVAENINKEADRRSNMEDLIKGHLLDTLSKYKRDAELSKKEIMTDQQMKPSTFLHTVKITLYNLTGSEATENIKVASFRITSNTRFTELKEEVCKFWSVPPKDMRLKAKNKEITEQELDQKVEQFVAKNAVPPDFSMYNSSFTGSDINQNQEAKRQVEAQSKREELDKHEQIERTLDNFLGLKRYMPVPVLRDSKNGLVSATSRDSSFCTLLFLILVAFLSIYIILIRRNITDNYWHQQEVRNALEKNLELSTKNFYKLVYIEDVYEYLNQIVAPAFFQEDLTTETNADYVGPVRLRQMRTKTTDCVQKDNLDLGDYKCYYPTYTPSTQSESSINEGNQSWENFNDIDDTDIVSILDGYISEYDGSGYFFDAKPNLMTQSQFKTAMQLLKDTNWIDNSTRALAITANIYIRSADTWITVLVLYELHVTGLIIPSSMVVSTFQPNMFERSYEKSAEAADICRLLFVLYFLYVYVITILEVTPNGRRNFGHVISFIGMIDLIMIFSVITAFGYSRTVNEDSENIYNSDDFTDMLNLSINYANTFTWNALAFFFTCLRTLLLLRLNSRILMIINTVEIAASSMLSYMIIFIPLLIGFCVCAMQTWGTVTFYYYNLDIALTSILILTIGHVDYEFMLRVNEGWTIFFLVVYFFVMSFFLFGAFMGIYMDTYRLIRLRDGYRDDESNWTKEQLRKWILAWLPRRVITIIEKIKKKAGDL